MERPDLSRGYDTGSDVYTVRFTRSEVLDAECIWEARVLLGLLKQVRGPMRVLLDFERVHFVSSGALGMLVVVNRVVRQHGGRLHLVNINPQVLTVMEITRLDRVFAIYGSVDEAMGRFAA